MQFGTRAGWDAGLHVQTSYACRANGRNRTRIRRAVVHHADLKAVPNLDKVEMLSLLDTAVTDDGCRELLRAHALVEISIVSDNGSESREEGITPRVVGVRPVTAVARITSG